jgi:hypothetical protein
MSYDSFLTGLPCAGPITGTFGQWYDGPPKYQHRGVDIGVPVGTPIYARAAGRVVSFTNYGDYGLGVCVAYDDAPLFGLCAHNSELRVALDQRVSPGQLLALSGATGKVNGPHCHYQININTVFSTDIAESVDPMTLILSEADMKSIERLEQIVAGNGFDATCYPGTEACFPPGTPVTPEGQAGPKVTLTGEPALEYARLRGFSLGLGLQHEQVALGRHVADGHGAH